MKTRKLGEVFEYPKMGTLKVVESAMPNDCNGCVFQSAVNPYCRNDVDKIHSGQCAIENREDNHDVIFIKAKGETND